VLEVVAGNSVAASGAWDIDAVRQGESLGRSEWISFVLMGVCGLAGGLVGFMNGMRYSLPVALLQCPAGAVLAVVLAVVALGVLAAVWDALGLLLRAVTKR